MSKKIKRLLLLVALTIIPLQVNAASANVSVSGSSTAVVGNKITLTVKLSSGTSIGSWQMMLDYDSSYLQFIGGGGEAGGMSMANSSSGTKSKNYTFTFKALKKGNTTVKVGSYVVYAYDDMSQMDVSSSGKSIKIMTQKELEATYSKDNSLKSLSVEGYNITPEFNKETLEYSVNVPEGTTSINIIAEKNDGTATVTGDGIKEVTEGTNSFDIVVKAQNGAERTYKITVNVIDENPVEIKIGKNKYTLVKYKPADFSCPTGFTDGTASISGFEVPSCVNNTIKYTLVLIKNEKGEISLAVQKGDKFELYKEINGSNLAIIPLEYDKKLKNYQKTTIKISGLEIEAFKYKEDSRYAIIYGMNIATGEKNLYMYDEKDQTIMLYNDELINDLEKLNNYYLYAIIAFGIGLFLSLVGLIKTGKKKKTTKESKVKNSDVIKEKKENKIEVTEETETFDLFESERKKKKKHK